MTATAAEPKKKSRSLTFYSPHDQAQITRAYRQLLKSIKTPLSDLDKKNIRIAFEMAVEAHSEQRRKSGEAYILHPIEVARICAAEVGLGATAIIAALLHDTVEDTTITLKDIIEAFGEQGKKIATIVDGLTKLDATDGKFESEQAENFKKILSTLVVDVRIVLIKMADRLHNMRTLGSMPKHKQIKIAAETEYIYAPLAHRLGLYSFRSEFLDLCLKITHRDEYNHVAKKLAETKRSREAYIASFLEPLEMRMTEAGIGFRTSGRPKSIYSIWTKMKAKNCDFEEIYDLFAIRIILTVPPERERSAVWQVYSMITETHQTLPERLKDWVTIPKSNGYESLHTTVIGPGGRYVEVQIRSERMDEISERGYAAHWKYKNVRRQEDVFERWFDSVRETLEKANSGNTVDFVQDFKMTNLFSEEVYVYTPKGDMKMMPKGSTALDFAFYIHSDLGYHCQAVKINNRIVPLGQKLQNGDQIQVEKNNSRKPSEDWLKWVVTSKARERIRQALREEEKTQADFGKEMVERKFDKLKINDLDLGIETVMKYFNFRSRHEFLLAVYKDAIDMSEDLKSFRVEKGKLMPPEEEKTPQPDPLSKSEPKPVKDSIRAELFIDGQSARLYEHELADCCRPVQGDDVFAYLTSNNLYKIHRTVCNNAPNLAANYGYRIKKAEWGASATASFMAELLITGVDTGRGVIERLSNRISTELGLNIRSFSISGDEGYFEGRVKVMVKNKDQLALAIKVLKSLEGVSNVIRVEN
jgi:GTP diphosphokinase / guanosine-3',5'-bis(diphosphate) 3'-diphosphatase